MYVLCSHSRISQLSLVLYCERRCLCFRTREAPSSQELNAVDIEKTVDFEPGVVLGGSSSLVAEGRHDRGVHFRLRATGYNEAVQSARPLRQQNNSSGKRTLSGAANKRHYGIINGRPPLLHLRNVK